VKEQSHAFCRWRSGEELEWFVLPTIAVIRFDDGSLNITLHVLKLEIGYYSDRSEYSA
jgi:hypothetical protein